MQDLANEIANMLEPSEPIGYVMRIARTNFTAVVLEAKAIKHKNGIGFVVRYSSKPYEESQLTTVFAPSEDALKFLIRNTYQEGMHHIRLEHPDEDMGRYFLDLRSCSEPSIDDERVLNEGVAALTLLKVPDNVTFRFDS